MKIIKNCQGCNKPIKFPEVTICVNDTPQRDIKFYCESCEYALVNDNCRTRNYKCIYCNCDNIDKLFPVELFKRERFFMMCDDCLDIKPSSNHCVVYCSDCSVLKPMEHMYCYLVALGKWICYNCNKLRGRCGCINNSVVSQFASYYEISFVCNICNKLGCSICTINRKYHKECIDRCVTLFECLIIKRKEVPVELKKIIMDHTCIPWPMLINKVTEKYNLYIT